MRETKETCDICGNSIDNRPSYLFRLCPDFPPPKEERRDRRTKYYKAIDILCDKECCSDCIEEFDERFEALVEKFLKWYT